MLHEYPRDRGPGLDAAAARTRRRGGSGARAAREEFHRLGAVRDEAAAADAIRAATERNATPSIAHKTFMFTDIVASTNIAAAIGDEAWEHLLRWHDDTLRAVFVDHEGDVENSTGDGFFVAFDSASAAIVCATAVQRALAEQRRTHGFAPRCASACTRL